MEGKKGGARGSFGMPEDVLNAVNASKAKARGEEAPEVKKTESFDSESIPEAEELEEKESPSKDPGPQKEPELTAEEIAAKMEKDLGITITEDDVWSFLFKGSITKKEIVIVPKMMHATFRTVTLEQTEKADEKLGEMLEKKMLESGFKNYQTKVMLACGVIELGKPGQLKSIGKDEAEREAALEKMASLMVDKLSKKWNSFCYLVNYTINKYQEGEEGKKS